jgi:autotransporter-associated beta strand protein
MKIQSIKPIIARFAALRLAALVCGLAVNSLHAQLYFDPGQTPATPTGGSGTWDTSSLFWSDLTSDVAWPNVDTSAAFFKYTGAGGTVTINTGSGVKANNLFLDDSYIIAGSTAADVLNLLGTTPLITANFGVPTISAIITGTNGLTLVGGTNTDATSAAATLTLTGNNTYSGGTTVNFVSGAATNFPVTLVAGSPTALGSTNGGVTVIGQTNATSTLALATGISVTNQALTLDSTFGTAQFSYAASTASTGLWSGNIVLKGTKNTIFSEPNVANAALVIGTNSNHTISNLIGSTPSLLLQGGNSQGIINSTIRGDFSQLSLNKQTTWTINSTNNSFTGPVVVNTFGNLKFYSIANAGVNSSLGAGSNIYLGALGSGGTPTLTWMGSNTVNGASSDRTIYLLDTTATGDIITPNYAGQTLTWNGGITTSNQLSDTLWTRGAGTIQINGQITDNTTNGLNMKCGSSQGTSLYNTNNSYRGYTSAEASSVLNFLSIANKGVNSSLGAGSNIISFGSGLIFFKGTNGIHNGSSDRDIRLSGGNNQIRLQQTGGLVLDLSGIISADLSAKLFIRDSGSMIIRGDIVDTTVGGMILQQASSGTVTLLGTNNNFFGQVQLQNGNLAIASIANKGVNCSLGNGTTNIQIGNASLIYVGTNNNSSSDRNIEINGSNQNLANNGFGLLRFSGNISNLVTGTGRTVTLNGTTGDGEFAGLIQDQLGVTTNRTSVSKLGTNTWTLSGANTYGGVTTVNAGVLLIKGSISSTVTVVNASSTLGGTGAISAPVSFHSNTRALLTLGSPLKIANSLIVTNVGLPVVYLNLSNNVPVGTYTLATNSTVGSSGSFSTVPVIVSGSLAAGNGASIATGGGLVTLTVAPLVVTTVTVASSVNPSLVTSNVTFTATIIPASGAVVPTGTVQFKTNGVALGAAQTVVTGVSPNGTVSISTANLPVGTHTVTAEFTGTGLFTGNTNSLTGGQVVNAPVSTPPGFPANAISVSGGTVSLTATGAIGGTFKLWATTNLALTPVTNTWTLLTNGTVTVSPFTLTDPGANTNAQRFYLFSTP